MRANPTKSKFFLFCFPNNQWNNGSFPPCSSTQYLTFAFFFTGAGRGLGKTFWLFTQKISTLGWSWGMWGGSWIPNPLLGPHLYGGTWFLCLSFFGPNSILSLLPISWTGLKLMMWFFIFYFFFIDYVCVNCNYFHILKGLKIFLNPDSAGLLNVAWVSRKCLHLLYWPKILWKKTFFYF